MEEYVSQNERAKNENPKIKTKKWKTKSARIKGVRPKASILGSVGPKGKTPKIFCREQQSQKHPVQST